MQRIWGKGGDRLQRTLGRVGTLIMRFGPGTGKPRAKETVLRPLPSLRDSVSFPLLPALKRWEKLFRAYGARFSDICSTCRVRRRVATQSLKPPFEIACLSAGLKSGFPLLKQGA